MKNEIRNLSLHDFTFALLGQDTEHYGTDIDNLLHGIHIERIDVIQYLRECIGNEDIGILKAIKDDMLQAFDEFFGWHTSAALQDSIKGTVSGHSVPKLIVWVNEKGRKLDLIVKDESCDIFDVAMFDDFDYLPLIDKHRIDNGLPSLKKLDLCTYKRAVDSGKHDLIRRLQKQHFEKHTLYAVAMDYLNERIDSIAISDDHTKKIMSKVNGIGKKKSFSNEDVSLPSNMPENLKNELRGTKGKRTALLVRAAIKLGWLQGKPTFSELQKIGVEGFPDGYNRYFNDGSSASLRDDEVEVVMNYLKQKV